MLAALVSWSSLVFAPFLFNSTFGFVVTTSEQHLGARLVEILSARARALGSGG
jgi:hypothetical protein